MATKEMELGKAIKRKVDQLLACFGKAESKRKASRKKSRKKRKSK